MMIGSERYSIGVSITATIGGPGSFSTYAITGCGSTVQYRLNDFSDDLTPISDTHKTQQLRRISFIERNELQAGYRVPLIWNHTQAV